MANRLVKSTSFDLVSRGSPARPAVAGAPGRAAYTAWEDVTSTTVTTTQNLSPQWVKEHDSTAKLTGGHFEYAVLVGGVQQGGLQTTLSVGQGGTLGVGVQTGVVALTLSSTSKRPVYHAAIPGIDAQPGIPATPAQHAANYHLGWNAGAESLGVFVGNLAYTFTVPVSTAGAQTGLSDPTHNTGYTGTEIDYAWSVSQGEAKVVERGVFKTNGYPVTGASVFKIVADAGVITYLLDDVLKYTSLTSSNSFSLIVDSSLYMGGDAIVDAAVTGGTTPIGSPAPVTGSSTVSAAPPTVSGCNLGAFTSHSAVTAAPPVVRASSIPEFIPHVSVSAVFAAPPLVEGYSVMGLTGSSAVTAAPPTVYASSIPGVSGHSAVTAAPPYVWGLGLMGRPMWPATLTVDFAEEDEDIEFNLDRYFGDFNFAEEEETIGLSRTAFIRYVYDFAEDGETIAIAANMVRKGMTAPFAFAEEIEEIALSPTAFTLASYDFMEDVESILISADAIRVNNRWDFREDPESIQIHRTWNFDDT